MIEEELNNILKKTFEGGQVIIENQSHLHAGHTSSPETGQSHFHVTIVSETFVDQSRVKRHQQVNNAVSELFSKGLHALSIATYTPEEYKRMN